MSYLCAEIRAYDARRKVVTVAFSEQWPLRSISAVYAEVTIADCGDISRESEARDAGLTMDETCVLKRMLENGGPFDETLAHPQKLVGRIDELEE